MHESALFYGKKFFEIYCAENSISNPKVFEIGSQDINGSLRQVAPKNTLYTGLDFIEGKAVDIVIDDPYKFPLPNECADIVVSSSCFEHSEFFWLTFLEITRISKPGGLIYLNMPSNGMYHKYPIDAWRFYPDSGIALANWARLNDQKITLIESFVGARSEENVWNDFVAVLQKEPISRDANSPKILDTELGLTNAHTISEFKFHSEHSYEYLEIVALNQRLQEREGQITALNHNLQEHE